MGESVTVSLDLMALLLELHKDVAAIKRMVEHDHQVRSVYEQQMTAVASLVTGAEIAPVAEAEQPWASDAPEAETQPTGASMGLTEASEPGHPDLPTAAPAAIRQQMTKKESLTAHQQARDIDPNELDFFVGQDKRYYIRGHDGQPDRRATNAEALAIDGFGKKRPGRH